MEEQEEMRISAVLIIIFLVAILLVAGGVFAYLHYTRGMDITVLSIDLPTLPKPEGEEAASEESSQEVVAANVAEEPEEPVSDKPEEADINDDGKVDLLDLELVRKGTGCTEDDDCWGDMVDKTITGHNPIYTSDLDLTQDGVVDEQDEAVITE